ncbi:hypothetical protein ACFY3G_46760 [Streptomyces phaeochromogenes]|uniref:hypothetical protein n=1 Tax=Streptomyces phaeochromogenes TaxID=1923 RepID=UPI00367786B5
MLSLVRNELAHVGPEERSRIAVAGGGNPGIAHALCRWTRERGQDLPAGGDTCSVNAGLPPGIGFPGEELIRGSIADIDPHGCIAAVATYDELVMAWQVAKAVGAPTEEVAGVLEAATRSGFLIRSGNAGLCYTVSHPLIGAAARELAGPERVAQRHLGVAATLEELVHGPSPAAVAVARHLLAAGRAGATTAARCLDASRWEGSQGRFTEVVELAVRGAEFCPDDATRCELLIVTGRYEVKAGLHERGTATLLDALSLTRRLGGGALFAEAVVELLDATPVRSIADTEHLRLPGQWSGALPGRWPYGHVCAHISPSSRTCRTARVHEPPRTTHCGWPCRAGTRTRSAPH